MIRLTINPYKCSGCGECEEHLPGLLGRTPLLINPRNSMVNSVAILSAMASCRLKAIKLEGV
jgi:ferredoxin